MFKQLIDNKVQILFIFVVLLALIVNEEERIELSEKLNKHIINTTLTNNSIRKYIKNLNNRYSEHIHYYSDGLPTK